MRFKKKENKSYTTDLSLYKAMV